MLLCSGGRGFQAVTLKWAGLGWPWCWEGPCTRLATSRAAGINLDLPCKYLNSAGRYFPQFPGPVVWSLQSAVSVSGHVTLWLTPTSGRCLLMPQTLLSGINSGSVFGLVCFTVSGELLYCGWKTQVGIFPFLFLGFLVTNISTFILAQMSSCVSNGFHWGFCILGVLWRVGVSLSLSLA